MKKNLLFILSLVPMLASAQTVVISDNFDSYTAGTPLAANSPLWTTWSGGVAGEDADVSSAQASSPPNSLYVIGNNGPTDLVLPFPVDYTAGVYELDLKIFVVSGKGAYFNLQSSMSPGVDWMLEVYFDTAGTATVNAGGAAAATPTYLLNAWNDINVHVDLTADLAELSLNGALVHTWQWSLGSDGAGATLSWGGVNIYAAASAPGDAEYFIDDVVLSVISAVGLNEATAISSNNVYPNPSNGNFELVYFSPSTSEAAVKLYNVTGEVISERIENIASGKNTMYFNNTSLKAGMYYLQVQSEGRTITKKIVIERVD